MPLFLVGLVVTAIGGYLLYKHSVLMKPEDIAETERKPDWSHGTAKVGGVLLAVGLVLTGVGLFDGGSGDGTCNSDGVCSNLP